MIAHRPYMYCLKQFVTLGIGNNVTKWLCQQSFYYRIGFVSLAEVRRLHESILVESISRARRYVYRPSY